MASIPVFLSSPQCSFCNTTFSSPRPSLRCGATFPSLRIRRGSSHAQARRVVRAVAEEAVVSEGGEAQQEAGEGEQQPVSVPVLPSDILTMFFKAEGTMSESAVSSVTDSLQEAEGISDLKVQVLEGIGSVQLTKQTTVQATGVASNLVEIIQGAGFKLQSLSLSFDDEEDAVN